MAKRAPSDAKPYRPLEESLVRAVLAPPSGGGEGENTARVLTPAAEAHQPALSAELPARQRPAPAASIETARSRQVSRAVPPDKAGNPPKLDREKRVLLTQAEERQLERVVALMGSEIGTSLKLSHVLRACVALILHSEEELLERSRGSPKLMRPANGDGPALTRFERSIAQVVAAAFRDARPLR